MRVAFVLGTSGGGTGAPNMTLRPKPKTTSFGLFGIKAVS